MIWDASNTGAVATSGLERAGTLAWRRNKRMEVGTILGKDGQIGVNSETPVCQAPFLQVLNIDLLVASST